VALQLSQTERYQIYALMKAVQYLKAIAQIRFRHAPVKELAED
jgi:hypothetical protein